MNMQNVKKSSNIKKIGYGDRKLRVEFSGGGIYEYTDVPAEIFDGFLKADSKGKYFYKNIRLGKYKYTRLDKKAEKEKANDDDIAGSSEKH